MQLNGILTLNGTSVLDAVLWAVIAAVLTGLVSLVGTAGFDVFSANWVMIGHNMVNLAFTAGVLSLGQDLLSTNSGSFLGITKPNAPTA